MIQNVGRDGCLTICKGVSSMECHPLRYTVDVLLRYLYVHVT